MPQQPISIIGAGIGGVTLGRALLKHGIPVVLYERMTSSPRHGYGITLHPSSYQGLLKVLDMDERTFRRRVAVDGAVGGIGAIDPKKLACPVGITSSSFRAHRERLESLIRQGLDIRWEHALERLEETPTGTTLFLQNGQRIPGQKCVVGADGPHANTRKSLLPEVEPNVLPFVTFNGKRRVKRSVFNELYAPAMKDTAIVESRKNGTLLQVSVNDNSDDLVGISWVYSRAAKRKSNDPCYKPHRSISGATEIPEEFYQEVGALKDLDQPYKEVFSEDKLRMDRVLSWLMRTVEVNQLQLDELASKGVYFMGDSVHAQAILGGEGANTAILDGLKLADHIAINGSTSVTQWYTKRFPSWQESLERSKRMIGDMHADQKSAL